MAVGCPKHRRGQDYDFDDEIVRLQRVQANLDRLTEIRLMAQQQRYTLRQWQNQVRDHLLGFDLVARLRTKDERLSTVDAAMPKVTQRLGEIELLLEQVEAVYWNLHNTTQNLTEQRQAAGKVLELNPKLRMSKGRKEHL